MNIQKQISHAYKDFKHDVHNHNKYKAVEDVDRLISKLEVYRYLLEKGRG